MKKKLGLLATVLAALMMAVAFTGCDDEESLKQYRLTNVSEESITFAISDTHTIMKDCTLAPNESILVDEGTCVSGPGKETCEVYRDNWWTGSYWAFF